MPEKSSPQPEKRRASVDERPAEGAASSGGVRLWQGAALLLALSVLGLGLYGLWPTLTGQTGEGPAAADAEAPSSTAQVEAVVARRVDFPLRARASGHLRPWQRATLHAETGGPVAGRAVREGDRVAEGALLARLEHREEQIAMKEARAELLKARAEFKAKYEGDAAALTASADSLADLPDPDRQATQAAASGLTAARQALNRAELNLQRTRIAAPFGGRVADLLVEEGQYVGAGEEVATLLRDRRMKVTVDVLERDFADVTEGAMARVHVPALGPEDDSAAVFEGRVWAVNPQVDPESGTGRVVVSIPNPEGRLVSGLYANVWLETRRLEGRLVVPEDAVLVRQGRDLVFVVEDGRAQWTYVEVGARSGERVEIRGGIAPGDTVATGGHFALAHDAPVEVTDVRALGR